MQYGFVVMGGEIREFAGLAAEAEKARWDGVFVADGIAIGMGGKPYPWFDPWVVLAAMATATERVKLGTFLTPVPRRRPWKLARETSTLDHLSGGRVILAVGLGAAKDDGGFCKVGEPMELKVRAELLDEGLEIINGLWSGKQVSFKGEHYTVDKMAMLPTPVQKPRIPIWVVGVWPKEKSLQRALRWDGIIPQLYGATAAGPTPSADDLRAICDYIAKRRAKPRKQTAFDIVHGGTTPGNSRKKAAAKVQPFIEAGATWWLEHYWGADVSKRIKQGPPRID